MLAERLYLSSYTRGKKVVFALYLGNEVIDGKCSWYFALLPGPIQRYMANHDRHHSRKLGRRVCHSVVWTLFFEFCQRLHGVVLDNIQRLHSFFIVIFS